MKTIRGFIAEDPIPEGAIYLNTTDRTHYFLIEVPDPVPVSGCCRAEITREEWRESPTNTFFANICKKCGQRCAQTYLGSMPHNQKEKAKNPNVANAPIKGPKSYCCKARLRVGHKATDGRMVCDKCGQACDLIC